MSIFLRPQRFFLENIGEQTAVLSTRIAAGDGLDFKTKHQALELIELCSINPSSTIRVNGGLVPITSSLWEKIGSYAEQMASLGKTETHNHDYTVSPNFRDTSQHNIHVF